jgi:hypothetical protein
MQKHIKARKIKAAEIHTQSTNVSSPWLLVSTLGFMPVFRTSYNHEFSTMGIGLFPERVFGPNQHWRDSPDPGDADWLEERSVSRRSSKSRTSFKLFKKAAVW